MILRGVVVLVAQVCGAAGMRLRWEIPHLLDFAGLVLIRPGHQGSEMSAQGHKQKSAKVVGMSAFGGKADLDFQLLDVCL